MESIVLCVGGGVLHTFIPIKFDSELLPGEITSCGYSKQLSGFR